MDEIELVQVDGKTEAESSSDEEVCYLLAEPSLLEEQNEEMIVISDEETTEKQENFDRDIVDLDLKTETTQQLPLIKNRSKYSNFEEDVDESDSQNETTHKEKGTKKMPGLRSITQDSQNFDADVVDLAFKSESPSETSQDESQEQRFKYWA